MLWSLTKDRKVHNEPIAEETTEYIAEIVTTRLQDQKA